MIALYLPVRRSSALDRARALLGALGPSAAVVSPHPAPPSFPNPWIRLRDPDPGTWRAWVWTYRPRFVVVDGSGPHTRAVTGMGATVAVVAAVEGTVDSQLGAAYSEADVILAPWARGSVDDSWPARWRERTIHLGGLGWQARSSVWRTSDDRPATGRRWHAVALSATASGPGPRERRATTAGTAGWDWTYAPDHSVLEDGPVWDALGRCTVVVCAPTPSNLAAVAAVQKPAVLVVRHGAASQTFLAGAALTSGAAVVRSSWPAAQEWPRVLDEARSLDGRRWRSWSPEPGLAALADAARPPRTPTRVPTPRVRPERVATTTASGVAPSHA